MKKRTKSIIALLLTVLMVGTVLTGCGAKSTPAADGTAAPDGNASKTLTFSVLNEIPSLDPQKENSMPSMEISNAIHEGLVRLHDGQVQPGVAEKWDISEDGKTYTFHLGDRKWSDGKPVTAQDFEYGIKRLLNPETASDYAFAGYCILNGYEYNTKKITDPSQVGVKAIDDKTLEIKLVNTAPYFLAYTNNACFYPCRQDLVEKYGSSFALEAANNVYNGPFILKEWKHEEGVTLEKNPNYWNQDAIKLDTVNILQVADANTAVNMYENGELDFVNVPTALVEKYAGKDKVYMNGAIDWLRLNLNSAGKPWLANQDFRKALNYALDREDYVKAATKNLYFPYTRLTLPMVNGVNGKKYTEECPIDVYPTKADAAKAKEYLTKAMTALNITDPSKMTIEIKTSDDDTAKHIAEVIQDQWTKNLGITVSIKLVTYKQKLADDTGKQYDAIYNGWMPDYDDPMTYIELFESANTQNSTGWSNAEYDKLVAGARVEADPAKREQMLWDAEKILVDECPLVPLQCRQVAYLEKDNLKGVSRYFIGSDIDFVYAYFE